MTSRIFTPGYFHRVRWFVLGVTFGMLMLLQTAYAPHASADSGTLTFTPGTGPIASSLLTAQQLAGLPTDVQNFLSTHRIGDTWTYTASINYAPGDPVPRGPYDCEPPNLSADTDKYQIELTVRLWSKLGGGGFATDEGWLIDGKGYITSCRDTDDSTLTETIQGRGHDNNQEFPLFTSSTAVKTCSNPYPCWWYRDVYITPNYVAVFTGDFIGYFITFYEVGIDATGFPPTPVNTFSPNVYFNHVVMSMQGSVSSAIGSDSKCLYGFIDTPGLTPGQGTCTYGGPLP